MTTIVFPGQGSQYINMSKDFYDNFIISRDIFNLVSEISKIDIKHIIFNNPDDFLNQTKYTQLSIFCASMAIFKALESQIGIDRLKVTHMLGHSLGEYTSLTAAKILSIEDCIALLKLRGELMQNAYKLNESGMAALLGLDCSLVEDIIEKNNLNVEVANDNSPSQVVISGIKEELIKSEDIFKDFGAKRFVMLNVSSAFHSTLMEDPQKNLNLFIKDINFKNSKVSIISNFNGKISNNPEILAKNLTKQMSNRVRWVESIKSLEVTEQVKVIEIGPGKVLSGLIKRISNKFNILNVDNILDMEKLINEL